MYKIWSGYLVFDLSIDFTFQVLFQILAEFEANIEEMEGHEAADTKRTLALVHTNDRLPTKFFLNRLTCK